VIRGGYFYTVSDEQLERFAQLTPAERLRWLEEARLFTLLASSPEARIRQERLRRGLPIVQGPDENVAETGTRAAEQ
jgi:hypothetical protein